jgi:hypothetical protein
MLTGIITALVCLALGCALGWFANRKIEGGRSTDPQPTEPPEPEALADEFYQQLRAAALAERKAEHADWDAKWRALTPPSAGVVWQRSPTGQLIKWPEMGYSPKGHKITDFNN